MAPQLIAPASVKVKLDRIPIPDGRSDVDRMLVEAAQTNVEIFVVPQIQKLGATVVEVGMADVNWSDERPIPVVELALHLDRLRGLGNQAKDRFVGSLDERREHREKQSDDEGRAVQFHKWLRMCGSTWGTHRSHEFRWLQRWPLERSFRRWQRCG